MACETMRQPRQTPQERAAEIRAAVEALSKKLVSGAARVVIGPQGAVAFPGFTAEDRRGVSDACAYRKLMVYGSALAKAKVAQAEALAGRGVSKSALAAGHHSHDGGHSWGKH